ncbi:hypothetical protein RRG08_066241 [Elysia crispata]|uniref:Uncharacterized protein n=1 Tax=Elysia crispata TaxID=231223 RepID=A0AAE1BDB9_9GAST|nr:hypothetical protein RRG08_066241 [Elysia crispata]
MSGRIFVLLQEVSYGRDKLSASLARPCSVERAWLMAHRCDVIIVASRPVIPEGCQSLWPEQFAPAGTVFSLTHATAISLPARRRANSGAAAAAFWHGMHYILIIVVAVGRPSS